VLAGVVAAGVVATGSALAGVSVTGAMGVIGAIEAAPTDPAGMVAVTTTAVDRANSRDLAADEIAARVLVMAPTTGSPPEVSPTAGKPVTPV
jgi:hypothetical protein